MHLMEPNINISNRKRIGLINNRIGNNQHNRNLAFDEIEIGYNDYPLLGPTNIAPRKRGYLQFIHQAEQVVEGVVTNSEVGINGVWIPHCLQYAHLLFRTKDIMHSAFNVVKDSIRVMKPHVAKPVFNNRTQSASVIQSCRDYSVFPFVYAEEPSWPWIFTNPEIQQHDNRFKLVLGNITQVLSFTLLLHLFYTNFTLHLNIS